DGAAVRSLPVGSLAYAVAISADGKRVAAGSFDGLVRLYDSATGKPLATLLSLPGNDWLAFAPTGHVALGDALVKLGTWSLNNRPRPADAAWKLLRNPDAVARSLRGETVPAPAFEK